MHLECPLFISVPLIKNNLNMSQSRKNHIGLQSVKEANAFSVDVQEW